MIDDLVDIGAVGVGGIHALIDALDFLGKTSRKPQDTTQRNIPEASS